jgi:DNA invertase Pin-like site-specific DNA recombinase
MIFNYIRVSTTDQNTERQLLDIPCDRAYIEKISGKNTDRPELQAMLLNIRSGDILNIHEMSRLARNTRDLLNLVEEITAKGATIIFHKENLTFKGDGKQDPYQKMMMTMLGAVAELERNLILERQREGIALAKLHGKYKGGQPKLTAQQVEEIKTLVNNRTPITQIARQYNISRRTVYNYLV